MTQAQEQIPVYITPDEAVLFVRFQQRFAFMKAMEDIGAFNLKNGSVEVHFDALGRVAKIDKHEHYKVVE